MRLSQCLNQPGLFVLSFVHCSRRPIISIVKVGVDCVSLEINILHIPDLYVLMVLPFVIIVLIYKQPCLLNIIVKYFEG